MNQMASVVAIGFLCYKLRSSNLTAKALFGYVAVFGVVAFSFFNLGRQWHTMSVHCNMTGAGMGGEASEGVPRLQTMSECNCTRNFFFALPGKHRPRLDSTCSDEGSFYERSQKVVSASLPQSMLITDSGYIMGITENLKMIKDYYPGTALRLYTDVNLKPDSEFCRLLCSNPQLHWCDVRKAPIDQSSMFPPTWKFLPLGDPTVDYFLSRDLNSAMIERQIGAVYLWLQSDKAFHVMRDKKDPEHNVPILGGLWGAKNSMLGLSSAEVLINRIIQLAKLPPKVEGREQTILNEIIFYPRKEEILAFDSYFCEEWGQFTEVRAYPFQRNMTVQNDFVGNNAYSMRTGAGMRGREEVNISKCPVACRPSHGRGWEYC